MDICIKYCGGCNPRYDRKKIVDKLKCDFKDINIITQIDNEKCDFVVIIAGCTSACVNHDSIEGKYGKLIIKNIRDYLKLRETLVSVIK